MIVKRFYRVILACFTLTFCLVSAGKQAATITVKYRWLPPFFPHMILQGTFAANPVR